MAVLRRTPTMSFTTIAAILAAAIAVLSVSASDNNRVYSPCLDTTVARSDGFTFGIAFAAKNSFLYNSTLQLSPCDSRLHLSTANSQIAVFRPKVDEISLLTVNSSSSPDSYGYMVAFSGRKYASRSTPAFVANGSYIVTSFTLVLEFKKGRLQNLYWKRDGCGKCSGSSSSSSVCLNGQDCAIKTSNCKNNGGKVDCSLGIQLAFSGTDKHFSALNSWYEVSKLRQYSLYGLYSNLKDSLTTQYSNFF